jgi:hypothetical protein
MGVKNRNHFLVLLIICFTLFGCSMAGSKVHFTDAKMAAGVDKNLAPVNVTDTFPQGTTRVFCWFRWKDSDINTQILAKWDYVTDQIHILDYVFFVPRRNGMGSVSLSMPEGKEMPSGTYRITFMLEKHILKSLTFEIK